MFSALAAVSPVSNRASMVNSWLSKIAGSDLDSLRASDSDNESERSVADDATLCVPSIHPQRSRAVSSVSENSGSSAAASGYSTGVFASSELPRHRGVSELGEQALALNHARINTAVALAVRARQEDELGRHDVAANMLVAALERLSASLHDTGDIRDPRLRERMQMHRLLLESSDSGLDGFSALDSPRPTGTTGDSGLLDSAAGDSSACAAVVAGGGLVDQAVDSVRATASAAVACGLGFLNRAIVLWLVFLGHVCMWAATQFRNSRLPELIVLGVARAGAWMYETCRVKQAPEHALRAGQAAMGWLLAMDREACFTQRALCSAAAILGAIARVAEQSSSRANRSST
ncbi:hypothetical protein IWW39_000706 [Coemansia spiralis]|uniref:Uncharacterized protein n=1 Tax=Coemansia spiralis TaxID=417178 RepID=A0A9W8GNT1_9FUNG|nr:hypothetical protein IWW39_000706 [Coemansia spiralis]